MLTRIADCWPEGNALSSELIDGARSCRCPVLVRAQLRSSLTHFISLFNSGQSVYFGDLSSSSRFLFFGPLSKIATAVSWADCQGRGPTVSYLDLVSGSVSAR